jgi:hypothetical protein
MERYAAFFFRSAIQIEQRLSSSQLQTPGSQAIRFLALVTVRGATCGSTSDSTTAASPRARDSVTGSCRTATTRRRAGTTLLVVSSTTTSRSRRGERLLRVLAFLVFVFLLGICTPTTVFFKLRKAPELKCCDADTVTSPHSVPHEVVLGSRRCLRYSRCGQFVRSSGTKSPPAGQNLPEDRLVDQHAGVRNASRALDVQRIAALSGVIPNEQGSSHGQ